MIDEEKTKEQLIKELVDLRCQVAELQAAGALRKEAGDRLLDREKQQRLQKQLKFTSALNRIAESIITNEDIQTILENMAENIGEALGVDRCLIYDMDFVQHLVIGLCEWLNPETPENTATKGTYSRDVFRNGTDLMMAERKWTQSHVDDVNPVLLNDGSADLLHRQMQIKSGLWYPFLFRKQGYFCLVFNQISHRRIWCIDELKFIIAAAKLVEIGIQKIGILDSRRQVERTLREQYHFLQRLIDTIPNPIFYKNIKGLFTGCNAAFQAYTGLAKENIIGKSVYEVYPGDLAEIYYEKDSALFSEPGVQVYETNFRVADGTLRDIVFNKATYVNRDGTLEGLVGVITDITERKQGEEALRAERQRLFSLLDGLPAFVYLQAPDYSISFSNRYFWEVFGKPKNRPCYEILYGRKQPCKKCPVFRVYDTKCAQVFDESILNGRYYQVYIYPFSDIDGSPLVLVLGIDITDRKRAEEAIRLSQELFFKAFNASPSMMAIARLADNKIINANDSFLNAVGYHREEIIGRPESELNLWESMKTRSTIIEMLRDGKPVRNLESKVCSKSGKVRVGLVSAELIEFGGESCLLLAVNDITERKQLEQEMAKFDRLNLVGEMAAAIGHEVRNPMTTVRGFLQLLGEKASCKQYKNYFDLMIDELDRANAIITQYLSLAKDKPVDKKDQNLNSILNIIFPLIQADVYKSDKYVNLELGDIPNLFLDDNEIRQLILNLVRNGLEAMSPGGVLTIKTYADAGHVVLAVQDQGSGIKTGVIDKLGTPFFTTKDNGTGLGLAVCYSIADRHNSKIAIETGSTGTTFLVRFPCSWVSA